MSLPPPPEGPRRPWLRLVLAVSLDGRLAPAGGGPAQLGGAGDRQVLEEALAWADACLIGARTLRTHGTTCLLRQADRLADRLRQGRPAQPIAIAVSRQGQLPAALPFLQQPLERWLLLAEPGSQPISEGFSRILPLTDWPQALDALARLGIERLVVLGGAELAGSLLALDRLDELQLTLCPRLLGGGHLWLPEGLGGFEGGRWRLLEQRPLEGDELLLRYGRGDGSSSPGVISS